MRNYIHTCIELERDTWIDNEWKPRSLRMRTRKRTKDHFILLFEKLMDKVGEQEV